MKKVALAIAASVAVASIAAAQTNVVLSRNAVGYIRVPLATNTLYLLSNPFVPMAPNADRLTNMLSVLPNGAVVTIWGEDIQAYRIYSKSLRGVWDASATTTIISRADAFFIRMPSSGSTTLFLMGEVPDRFTAPTTTQTRVPGITMVGYPYPVTELFTNTSMAANVPNGGSVSVWDSASGSYIIYSKSLRGVWNAIATNAIIQPGQGFVIRTTAAATNWNTVKPYTWP